MSDERNADRLADDGISGVHFGGSAGTVLAYPVAMTPSMLRMTATRYFGTSRYWYAPLAAMLGISERTVRAWASGRDPIPGGIRDELVELGHRRIDQIAEGIKELERLP